MVMVFSGCFCPKLPTKQKKIKNQQNARNSIVYQIMVKTTIIIVIVIIYKL